MLKEVSLGDLLASGRLLGRAGARRKACSTRLDDVVAGIVEKLVTRHPHVFGDLDAKTADEVLRNWEKIKAQEKKDRGILAGVPRAMPALARAQRIGEKVQRVGFDWSDARGSFAKVKEEIGEIERAIEAGEQADRGREDESSATSTSPS